MNPKPPPREQEQSIRARTEQLYEEDQLPVGAAAGRATKPFEAYLREVPATPLSALTKAILWGVGALVVLLLLVTLLRATGGSSRGTKKSAVLRHTTTQVA